MGAPSPRAPAVGTGTDTFPHFSAPRHSSTEHASNGNNPVLLSKSSGPEAATFAPGLTMREHNAKLSSAVGQPLHRHRVREAVEEHNTSTDLPKDAHFRALKDSKPWKSLDLKDLKRTLDDEPKQESKSTHSRRTSTPAHFQQEQSSSISSAFQR